MENTDTKQKNSDEMSFGEEIIYFLKLMRSIVIYHYRYDEVFDEDSSWRDIFIVVGISTLISGILVQISRMASQAFLGARAYGNGFQGVLEMLSVPAFSLQTMLITFGWYIITIFIVTIGVSVVTGYCFQLWFSDSQTLDNKEWIGFSLAVALIRGFQLIVVQPLSESNLFLALSSPLRGQQNFLPMLVLLIVVILLGIYAYYVLSRLIRSRNVSINNFWLKFILIVLLTEGISVLFSWLVSFLLAPVYSQVIQMFL